MRFSCLLLAAALVPSFGPAATLHAQVRLEGIILENETEVPVGGALVEVFDAQGDAMGQFITDQSGTFRFELNYRTGYRLQASRMGYQRTMTPVLWADRHNYFQVEVRLDPDAILLAPIEITAWAARPSPILQGFRDRMASGMGYYFTREDIERLRPIHVSDVVARVPGVRIASSGFGDGRTIYLSRALGNLRDCPAQIFIDGFLINRRSAITGEDFGFALDQAVSPNSVEGIEVYKGLATIPAEFANEYSRCGVVAVWTRRGDVPG